MIDLQKIVIFNGAAIILLLVIILSAKRTLRPDMRGDKLFLLMVLMTIVQACIETLSFCLTGSVFFGSYVLNMLINDALFINNTLFAYLWLLYVESKLFTSQRRSTPRHILTAIPALCIVLLSLVNLVTPVFFRVDRVTCEYSRTPLYFIPNAVALFYLAFGLIQSYRYRRLKYIFFPAMLFLVPIVIALIVEYYMYGMNVLWLAVSISLTSIYINLQNQITNIDSLSGLFSRQYLISRLQAEIKRAGPGRKLIGIMLDINRFKLINDNFGHLVGDDAISSTGILLRSTLSSNVQAFRFAGDEFVLIQTAGREEEALELIASIKREATRFNAHQGKPYSLSFSVGYAVFGGDGDTLDAFLERMDAAMYADKNSDNSPS